MTSCVYLTIYRGPHLPPFYIGSSTVEKLNAGYKGSVSSVQYKKIWREELKHHPERFRTFVIKICESRKDALELERRLQIALNVVRSPLYINQAVAAPKGYCGADFKGANSPNFGKTVSIHTRKLLSDQRMGIKQGPNPKKARPGKLNGMFGKNRTLEEKQRMAATRKLRNKEQNIKSYSRKKGDAERAKISAKADNRGAKNPRARDWVITAPNGQQTKLCGNFKHWCRENGLPSGSKISVDGTTMTNGKWAGWSVLRL